MPHRHHPARRDCAAGFRDAWRHRDCSIIVSVVQRLPERVVQEDADLLTYYDNALMRMEPA